MTYKLGQKVWSKLQKKYMFVSQIERNGCFLADDEKLLINYWHGNTEFNETAEDMFETLGWIKLNSYDTDIDFEKDGNKIISFNLKEQEYQCYSYDEWRSISISIEEHFSITQQMKEFGWVE